MGDSSIFCGLKEIFTQFELSDESSLSPSVMRVALANAFEQKQSRREKEGGKKGGRARLGYLSKGPRGPSYATESVAVSCCPVTANGVDDTDSVWRSRRELVNGARRLRSAASDLIKYRPRTALYYY